MDNILVPKEFKIGTDITLVKDGRGGLHVNLCDTSAERKHSYTRQIGSIEGNTLRRLKDWLNNYV
jgi:hypothetical protein